jgi:putative ABC transport system substrate-binding protein
MKRTAVLSIGLAVVMLAVAVMVEAQQPKKVPRIGYLSVGYYSSQKAFIEALWEGLRDLGYVEGKNINLESRYAEGKLQRLPGLASELVGLKVNVIITGGPAATQSAKEATSTIPIVTAQDIDPVGLGFVATLAKPGGNITGLATLSPEMSGKQVGILKEIIPKLSRVAVIGTSISPGNAQVFREAELAAGGLGSSASIS